MNQLVHIDEFKEVLAHYQLSDEAKRTLRDIHIVLLVGPSSSGRNTIINELVKSGDYYFIVSDTTRQPRVNNGVLEENGREYWFRSEVDILADLKEGKFLEAAIIHNQQVSGISMRELNKAVEQHKIAIDEIEVVGADNIHALIPAAQFLFVLPPSFDEWMTRMSARGELPAVETKRRLESAVAEITMALERDFYTFVVNDTFVQTAKQVDAIIHEQKADQASQDRAKAVAQQLRTDTQQFLEQLVV
jgi:guanylate kinase